MIEIRVNNGVIEIRVNNGVIEYRHRLREFPLSRSGLVVSKVWGDWRKAEQVPEAFKPGFFRSPMHGANGDVIWFDEAADINAADWSALAEALKPPLTVTDWQRAYQKAIWRLRGVSRQLEDERAKHVKQIRQRDIEVHTVRGERNAALQENKALHAELDSTHAQMVALQEDNRALTNVNSGLLSQLKDVRSMLKTAEQTLLARQGELTHALAVAKRYAFRSGGARALLKRARAVIAMFTPHGTSGLINDIDAALKG